MQSFTDIENSIDDENKNDELEDENGSSAEEKEAEDKDAEPDKKIEEKSDVPEFPDTIVEMVHVKDGQ